MAKKTIEEVREFIFKNSNGECELLSKEYENKKTPLKIRCRCGNIFERKWENLNKNFIQCKDCTNKHRSEKYSFSQEYIIDKINSTGCKYISGEYVNSRSLLTIQCRCGKIFKKDYCNFSAGADRCPECGNENARKSKIKYFISMDLNKKTGEVYSQKELLEKGKKLIESGDRRFIDSKIDSEKMGIMLFTSGTTSISKAVMLSHKNIVTNIINK